MRGTTFGRAAAVALALHASPAIADILLIDTNDQAVERQAAIQLGRTYGEAVHIVPGEGPELDAVFARAERGEIRLTTIVGSGHSGGTTFFGKQGRLSIVDELVEKHPKARKQVRHFIGLGCYTGTKYNGIEWQRRFPNATVIAGFAGSAPSGAWSAKFLREVYSAIGDARRQAGGNDGLARQLGQAPARQALRQTLAALASVRNTVGTFLICEQFYDPKGTSKAKTREQMYQGMSVFQNYLNAWGNQEDVPPDPHATSPLRVFYNDVQSYLGVADPSERELLLKIKEQTIRLIYFGNVKRSWARAHEPERAGVNRTLGAAGKPTVPPPAELARMTRRQVLNLGYSLDEALSAIEADAASPIPNESTANARSAEDERIAAARMAEDDALAAARLEQDRRTGMSAAERQSLELARRAEDAERAAVRGREDEARSAARRSEDEAAAARHPGQTERAALRKFVEDYKRQLVELDTPFEWID